MAEMITVHGGEAGENETVGEPEGHSNADFVDKMGSALRHPAPRASRKPQRRSSSDIGSRPTPRA